MLLNNPSLNLFLFPVNFIGAFVTKPYLNNKIIYVI